MKTLRTKQVEVVATDWKKLYDDTTWLGFNAQKNPTDAWLYQEIIYHVKPDFVLETGACKGGGALFLASMMDLCQIKGDVYSIEVNRELHVPYHPKISWVIGSSIDPKIVKMIKKKAKGKRGMVFLDSDHNTKQVLAELQNYWDIVSPGSYLIVEDTWYKSGGDGPYKAILEFLKENKNFKIDESMHRFQTSNNPYGFLKRK